VLEAAGVMKPGPAKPELEADSLLIDTVAADELCANAATRLAAIAAVYKRVFITDTPL